MLNGTVSGDVYHGNVTNYYNSHSTPGDSDPNDPDTYHNVSSVLSDSEKKELLQKLHFPQLDARLTNLRRAGRRTCEWLLRRKDYQEWMDMDSKHFQAQDGLFWIHGNPGTGKSIAMKFLFQKMQHKLKRSHDQLVLSFFFNARGSDLEKSTLGLYRSLLFGLLSSDPSLLEALDDCSRGQYLGILSGEWEQRHEPLLQELFEKAIKLLAARKKSLYCYVDALDECPENQIRDMVRYFEDLKAEENSHKIRVCFSSRHYPRISIKTKLTITLEHEANHNNDIKTYIGSELRFDEHTDQTEVDELRDAIFQRSAGIFLWVSLVVRQLNDVFDNDGRMDAVWDRLGEIPRAAKEIPLSHGDLPLYGLFQDVIMKDTRNIPALVRLTQLIFCAKRPFRPQEAFVALYKFYHTPFDAEKVGANILSKHILAISKGLAEVTSAKEPTVQFIHETVREFLRDGGLSIISEQSMQGDGNEILKISCLDQIKALDSVQEHFELLADYRTWTRYRNQQDKDVTASQREEFRGQVSQIFPFLEYSTQYVLSHANAAASQGVPQRPFLDSFPRHFWVPLHNLLEKAYTKRFAGSETPMLYILAGHGLNDLIRLLTDQRNYATLYKNEQCQTSLHNAIYSGNLDAAWILVGLDPEDRPPRLNGPRLNLSGCRKTLLRAILDAGDVEILRKVIQDLGVAYLQQDAVWAQGEKRRDLILHECRSVAMIDCLFEHSMLPSSETAEGNAQNGADGDESVSATSDLFFIRRAIDKEHQLLTEHVWAGQCMLDYAVEKRFPPLFSLYFELASSRGLATLNECVERAAMGGWLVAVKEAHSRGADLDYQNESGCTLLHKMFGGNCFQHASSQKRIDMCSVLEYLLFKNPKLGASVDRDGYTAFDLIRNELWGYQNLEPEDIGYKKALEIFVKARAMTKTGFIRKDHQYPWVAVPWISVPFSMKLAGETQFTNINARDSLGRTALSWCFSLRPPKKYSFFSHVAAREKGRSLLKYPRVDVNSRDNSGRTILEHLIRNVVSQDVLESLTAEFFQSSALDVNLETSERHSPLDLIISLYDTWPLEFGGIDAEFWPAYLEKTLKGAEKKAWFSEGLLKTARLLLATKRVDVSEQKRCLEKAPDDLRDLILKSIREVEPDYHLQAVDIGSQ